MRDISIVLALKLVPSPAHSLNLHPLSKVGLYLPVSYVITFSQIQYTMIFVQHIELSETGGNTQAQHSGSPINDSLSVTCKSDEEDTMRRWTEGR